MTADSADDPVVPGQDAYQKTAPALAPAGAVSFPKATRIPARSVCLGRKSGFSFTLDRQLALRL
jgi:hypothetical protein